MIAQEKIDLIAFVVDECNAAKVALTATHVPDSPAYRDALAVLAHNALYEIQQVLREK